VRMRDIVDLAICLAVACVPIRTVDAQALKSAIGKPLRSEEDDARVRSPVVVEVAASTSANASGRESRLPPPRTGEINLGSGTVVSLNGHIVTNAHVVDKCENLAVLDIDGNEHPAHLVLKERRGRDLALIQMNAPLSVSDALPSHIAFPPPGTLTTAGQTVRIAGYPYSQGQAFRFALRVGSVVMPAERTNFALAFRATMDVGSSGGPIIDSRGRLVGVVAGRVIGSNDLGVGFTADEVTEFLGTANVNYARNSWVTPLSASIIEQIARRVTVGIKCTY
jgi:S1-C subfamily serine protease